MMILPAEVEVGVLQVTLELLIFCLFRTSAVLYWYLTLESNNIEQQWPVVQKLKSIPTGAQYSKPQTLAEPALCKKTRLNLSHAECS